MTKVSEYQMVASNGRKIRKATAVTFSDGQTIKFTERLSKRDAIKQATALITKLENALAVAIYNGDREGQTRFTRALEVAVNATDFPKVSA